MGPEKLIRIWDHDGEYETSILAALKDDGTTEVFYIQTRKRLAEDKKHDE